VARVPADHRRALSREAGSRPADVPLWVARRATRDHHPPVGHEDAFQAKEPCLLTLVPGNKSSSAGHHSPPRQTRAATGQIIANAAGGSGISGFSGHVAVRQDRPDSERLKQVAYVVAELPTYLASLGVRDLGTSLLWAL
jgi:anti-sigma factor RsiW